MSHLAQCRRCREESAGTAAAVLGAEEGRQGGGLRRIGLGADLKAQRLYSCEEEFGLDGVASIPLFMAWACLHSYFCFVDSL